jgi:hypothetical protein
MSGPLTVGNMAFEAFESNPSTSAEQGVSTTNDHAPFGAFNRQCIDLLTDSKLSGDHLS